MQSSVLHQQLWCSFIKPTRTTTLHVWTVGQCWTGVFDKVNAMESHEGYAIHAASYFGQDSLPEPAQACVPAEAKAHWVLTDHFEASADVLISFGCKHFCG